MTGRGNGSPKKDFEPGHMLSVKHGAYSPRVVEPIARRLLDELQVTAASWIEEVDTSALTAWAHAEARCEVLRDWCATHGLLDAKGKPTGASDLLLRCEKQAADQRSRLGLDPLARARLGRDTAQARLDLAKLWAEQPADGAELDAS